MSLIGWPICQLMIRAQRRDGLAVDPALVAGHAPKWAISSFWLVVLIFAVPFVIWLLLRILPQTWMLEFARFIWSIHADIPSFSFLVCGDECRDLVFGMAALPAAWLSGVLGAIWWFRILSHRLEYQQRLIQSQSMESQIVPAVDKLALSLKRQPISVAMQFVAIGTLAWFLPRFVGEVHYADVGRGEAYTTWRFAFPCAILGLAIASTGAIAFILLRISRLSR
jgi:hypothetical protein